VCGAGNCISGSDHGLFFQVSRCLLLQLLPRAGHLAAGVEGRRAGRRGGWGDEGCVTVCAYVLDVRLTRACLCGYAHAHAHAHAGDICVFVRRVF
jgi:hypothetical protein